MRTTLLVIGVLLIGAGTTMLLRREPPASFMVGIERDKAAPLDCYTVTLEYEPEVGVGQQFVIVGRVTPVGWGFKNVPHLTLQLSAAGMAIDPGNPITPGPFAGASPVSARWTAFPSTAGTFQLVLNANSMSHPLGLINSDGVFRVIVREGWLSILSKYLGWLITFLGSMATLPGILKLIKERTKRRRRQASPPDNGQPATPSTSV